MGLTISSFWNKLMLTSKPTRVMMVGLDAAGKTTVLYKMRLGDVITTVPTIGFNVEELEYKKVRMTVWDIGGQDKIRALWKYYYQGSDAVVFVVDSSDATRLTEAADELRKLLCEDELRDAKLLVLANKQDMPGAMSVATITQQLGLMETRNRKWFVQACSAVSGDGLHEGFDWLANAITQR